MALNEEKTHKNDLALPAGQTDVHQSSKNYLLSMLQDSPDTKPQYSRMILPSTSRILQQPRSVTPSTSKILQQPKPGTSNAQQQPMKIESVLMGLSGDGKRLLLLPSNLAKVVQKIPASQTAQLTTVAQTTHVTTVAQTTQATTVAETAPVTTTSSEAKATVKKGRTVVCDVSPTTKAIKEFDNGKKDVQMGPRCNCKLSIISKKFHCNDITNEERLEMFTDFWRNNDWKQRRAVVCSLVKCGIPNARRKACGDPSRKEFAFQYNLKKKGKLFRVCKIMFLTTLSLGDGTVRDWVMSEVSQKPYVGPI